MKNKLWFSYALATTLLWGVWGAFTEIPEKGGFPATLGYSIWALMMIPCALFALNKSGWIIDHDRKSIIYGLIIGFFGSGGTVVLFQALRTGPAYLIFPVISLSPVITILLSIIFLKEKASPRSWIGIVLALIAIPLVSYQPRTNGIDGVLWLILSLAIFIAWGVQAFFIKLANETMKAESIFTFMAVTSVALIPFTIASTDFSQPVNWGFKGPWLSAMIQILNAIGALSMVYAFRYGRAIIVSPMINAGAPVITIIISLIIYAVLPHPIILAGMVFAAIAIFLMSE